MREHVNHPFGSLNGREDSLERLTHMLAVQRTGRAKDGYFYHSQRVFELELRALLLRSWIYAGHVSELPDPGDFLQLELAGESVLVTRDAEGGLHALLNSCRHRGARVCEGERGNRRSFVCPYHGWTYDLAGRLRAARGMDRLAGFRPDQFGLRRLSVAQCHGLIFVNFNLQAGDLGAALAPIDVPLGAYRLSEARIAARRRYRVEANWKLALENYLECYHCATAHRAYARMHTLADPKPVAAPAVEAMLAVAEERTGVTGIGIEHRSIYAAASAFGACASHQRYGLKPGFLTGSEDGQPLAPLMGDFKGYDGGAGDFQFGPITFMLNYPDHCVLYRFLPRDLESTDMDLVWFVRGDAKEGRDYDLDRLTWLWHTTTREDEYIIRRNAAGVGSRFFVPGPYHPEFESAAMEFDQWYLDGLRAATA
jgi:Rieske 2Fe-2S family protein